MEKTKSKMLLILGMVLIFVVGNATGASAVSYLEQIIAYLDHGIKLNLNGSEFVPKDNDGVTLDPINYNGTTYLPLRSVAEATGMKVKWNEQTRTASFGDGYFREVISKASGKYGIKASWDFDKVTDLNLGSIQLTHNTTDSSSGLIIKANPIFFYDNDSPKTLSEALDLYKKHNSSVINISDSDKQLTINGYDAVQVDIKFTDNYNNRPMEAYGSMTIIKTAPFEFVSIVTWADSTVYETIKEELNSIIQSFKKQD